MPTYELVILMKQMKDTALKVLLSRTATYILESGATLRKLENLGLREPPVKLNFKGASQVKTIQYYLFEYDAGIKMNNDIKDKFYRDVDILRFRYFCKDPTPAGELFPEKVECKVQEDLLPPSSRPNVLKLMEASKKLKRSSDKEVFSYGTGNGIDPF